MFMILLREYFRNYIVKYGGSKIRKQKCENQNYYCKSTLASSFDSKMHNNEIADYC